LVGRSEESLALGEVVGEGQWASGVNTGWFVRSEARSEVREENEAFGQDCFDLPAEDSLYEEEVEGSRLGAIVGWVSGGGTLEANQGVDEGDGVSKLAEVLDVNEGEDSEEL